MKIKAAPSRGHVISEDMGAIKSLVWEYGCWHVGNYRQPHMVREYSRSMSRKRDKITKVFANHVKQMRLHAREEEQSLLVVSKYSRVEFIKALCRKWNWREREAGR